MLNPHHTYQKNNLAEVPHWPQVTVVVFISSIGYDNLRANSTYRTDKDAVSANSLEICCYAYLAC